MTGVTIGYNVVEKYNAIVIYGCITWLYNLCDQWLFNH